MGGERIVRIVTKSSPELAFAVDPLTSNGVLMPIETQDLYQTWILDNSESHENIGFCLVNKGTGKALTLDGPKKPVRLAENGAAGSLWTLENFDGKGFHSIQAFGTEGLSLDVFKGLHEAGTPVIAHEWKEGANQMWTIRPDTVHYTIRSRVSKHYALSITPEPRGRLIMKELNERDITQQWTLEMMEDNAFTITSTATRLPVRASVEGEAVRMADASQARIHTVWCTGKDEGGNYFALRPVDNIDLNLDAVRGSVSEECEVILHKWKKGKKLFEAKDVGYNQIWGFFPVGQDSPIRPQ